MSERFRTNNLAEVIETQGRTKQWVAGQAGFSASMLGHVIAGRKPIVRDRAERISTALGVPFTVLWESTDDAAATDAA
jgi:hypothetical protein